ncbi:hypothetical protein CoNPh13_CDS0206 [Staphylococcus phage S-CoN_Ph13]|nr:hypothetical protein CoNPh13_CDS0206 [Staphylococcus phage S-CoN_Ph13]
MYINKSVKIKPLSDNKIIYKKAAKLNPTYL